MSMRGLGRRADAAVGASRGRGPRGQNAQPLSEGRRPAHTASTPGSWRQRLVPPVRSSRGRRPRRSGATTAASDKEYALVSASASKRSPAQWLHLGRNRRGAVHPHDPRRTRPRRHADRHGARLRSGTLRKDRWQGVGPLGTPRPKRAGHRGRARVAGGDVLRNASPGRASARRSPSPCCGSRRLRASLTRLEGSERLRRILNVDRTRCILLSYVARSPN